MKADSLIVDASASSFSRDSMPSGMLRRCHLGSSKAHAIRVQNREGRHVGLLECDASLTWLVFFQS